MRRFIIVAIATSFAMPCLIAGHLREAIGAPQPAQPDENPSYGEWTLTIEVSGGIPAFGLRISYRGLKRFRVEKDGSFSWETSRTQGDEVEFRTDAGGQEVRVTSHGSVFMRGRGIVDKEHALALHLESTSPTSSWSGSWTLSGDRSRWQTSAGPFAAGYVPSNWKLTPISREVEQVGPDVERETITYRAGRASTIDAVLQPIPVNERIEVTHVRYGEIVPRAID